VTPYGLFLELRALYKSGRDLHLRRRLPDSEELRRRRQNLVKANVLTTDPDYSYRAYQVVGSDAGTAEDVACIVDPFCCIAYLSAMARYGLTDRRPHDLHIKTPDARLRARWLEHRLRSDYGTELDQLEPNQVVSPRGVNHPPQVRSRPIQAHVSVHMGDMIDIRDSHARVTTIGQTFVDMLEHPDACGGMAHILDLWEEHAGLYVNEIVETAELHPRPIVKVRAGYILDERLGTSDDRIESWTRYAQRGGSRVLDPGSAFAPVFSEKWMLSLNVG
jgi:hypothetical protein